MNQSNSSQDINSSSHSDGWRGDGDAGGRKVKITSSRGHPHTKGTGDYSVNRPGRWLSLLSLVMV